MVDASMGVATASTPTKTRLVYFLVALPSTRTSSRVASLQSVRHVSTGTSV